MWSIMTRPRNRVRQSRSINTASTGMSKSSIKDKKDISEDKNDPVISNTSSSNVKQSTKNKRDKANSSKDDEGTSHLDFIPTVKAGKGRKKKKTLKEEKQGYTYTRSTKLGASTHDSSFLSKQQKSLNKKVNLQKKLIQKNKQVRLSENKIIDLTEVQVVLTDCGNGTLFQHVSDIKEEPVDTGYVEANVALFQQHLNIKVEPIDTGYADTSVHFEGTMGYIQSKDDKIKHFQEKNQGMKTNQNKANKKSKRGRKKLNKQSKTENEALEEYKQCLPAEVETTETSQAVCTPIQSTPSSLRTFDSLDEAHSLPSYNDNDNVHIIDDNETTSEVSMDTSSQSIYAESSFESVQSKDDEMRHFQEKRHGMKTNKNKANKKSKHGRKKLNKETKAEIESLEEYKQCLLTEIERTETSSTQVECTLIQSTPSSLCTSDITVETDNPPLQDDNYNAHIRIDNNGPTSKVSMDTSSQSICADKKKRKISQHGDITISQSITEEYCSTQDESVDDSSDIPNELHDGSSLKRKWKDRKYHKKKKKEKKKKDVNVKDKDGNQKEVDSTLFLQDELQALDIVVENMEEEFAENIEEESFEEEVRYIPTDFDCNIYGVLILGQSQMIAMKGCMQLTVLHGEVDVSGYKMVGGKGVPPSVDVFSVSTSSLFYIKDTSPASCTVESKEKLLLELANAFQSSKENVAELLCEPSEIFACVIVKRLCSVLPALLRKLNNFRGFVQKPKFLPQPFQTGVLETDHWADLITGIQNDMAEKKDDCMCSVMVCGAGNVGKSSFVRYSINRMLEKYDAVFCLDCDCGQSEFTPPSVLSLVKVTKPLIGLPFSHQLTPACSYFFGHISPGDTPSEYIKLIGYLFQTYYVTYYSEGPLVINTQGWMQGLGLSLLMDCIRMTSPCHIIHISGPNAKNDIPTHLSDEIIESIDGWDIDETYKCMKKGHGCTYHNLSTTDVQRWYRAGNKSRMAREQCISSYFASLYEPYLQHALQSGEEYGDWIPPSLSVIEPYVLSWKGIALHIMHEKVTDDVMLSGFNLSLVGLARVDPELITSEEEDSEYPNLLSDTPVADYLGFGIIRNIDTTNKLFYILTPEPGEKLKEVNALLRGSAKLPTSYFLEE